jgi:hypothetical protein
MRTPFRAADLAAIEEAMTGRTSYNDVEKGELRRSLRRRRRFRLFRGVQVHRKNPAEASS